MTQTFVDPSSNIRDEIAASSGMPELFEKIWFHKTAAAVIDADRCVGCGGCIAACPSRSIGVAEDKKPTLVKMCTGCSACWDYCPLAGLRVERLSQVLQPSPPEQSSNVPSILGAVRSSYSARAVNRRQAAQDGGVVTAIIASLIDAGEIDGAILTQKEGPFTGRTFLATSAEEVYRAAGTVYHQTHTLAALNEPLPRGIERLAFVGTPCQVSVLRALQKYTWKYRSSAAGAVVLSIALFCTRSFDPNRLESAISAEGVQSDSISKIDIRDGQLIAQDKWGTDLLRRPVKQFASATLKGCDECSDFAGLNADLAVGNIGSESGYSTVLVRTEAGEKAISAAAPNLALNELNDLDPVVRIAIQDKKRAERNAARSLDADAELWISYGEHLDSYYGTERTPMSPPAFRSYHFDVSC